jgi:hypothetical protein
MHLTRPSRLALPLVFLVFAGSAATIGAVEAVGPASAMASLEAPPTPPTPAPPPPSVPPKEADPTPTPDPQPKPQPTPAPQSGTQPMPAPSGAPTGNKPAVKTTPASSTARHKAKLRHCKRVKHRWRCSVHAMSKRKVAALNRRAGKHATARTASLWGAPVLIYRQSYNNWNLYDVERYNSTEGIWYLDSYWRWGASDYWWNPDLLYWVYYNNFEWVQFLNGSDFPDGYQFPSVGHCQKFVGYAELDQCDADY